MCHRLPLRTRHLEQPSYKHHWLPAETYNSISNIPFMIIAILRLYQVDVEEEYVVSTEHAMFYHIMFWIGICSFIHHMTLKYWTIVLDWTPICICLYVCVQANMTHAATSVSWFQGGLAFLFLINDHLTLPIIPVPWGHSFWHILAAMATDSFFQDYMRAECE